MASELSIYAVQIPGSDPATNPGERKQQFTKLGLPPALRLKSSQRGSQRRKDRPSPLHKSEAGSSQTQRNIDDNPTNVDGPALSMTHHHLPTSRSNQTADEQEPTTNEVNPRKQQQHQHQHRQSYTDQRSENSPSLTPVSTEQSDTPGLTDTTKDEQEDDSSSGPASPTAIDYGAPPLNKVHFSCYQFHRSFVPSHNFRYSLQCMTCLKFDQQIRWRCVFCCLRICGDCVKGIKECKDRSLIEFTEKLVQSLEAA